MVNLSNTRLYRHEPRLLFFRKRLPVHHGIPAVFHRGVPGPYQHCDKEEIKSMIYIHAMYFMYLL